MRKAAIHKRLILKSLAVISAIAWLGTALSAGNADSVSDPRPQGAATEHATFSMY